MHDLEPSTATGTSERLRESVDVRRASAESEGVVPRPVIASDFPSAWVTVFRDTITSAGLSWVEPHRSGDTNEVSLEWWKGKKNLTVFIRGYQTEVLKVWGSNINDEMKEMPIATRDELLVLWRWFTAP
jgi:hypothetical protein